MIFEYIKENYEKDEPIFISELPFDNQNVLRQEMKRLTDSGKLVRAFNGTYYQAYTTILGTKGMLSINKYISKKYLIKNNKINGFLTGLSLANKYGFTTQVPSVIEVTSNEATTKQRKVSIDGFEIIVYSPVTLIGEQNVSALQFLDLMQNIDKYSELSKEELKIKLKEFVKKTSVNFEEVKKYIFLYPDRVYRNIYEGGLMNELV